MQKLAESSRTGPSGSIRRPGRRLLRGTAAAAGAGLLLAFAAGCTGSSAETAASSSSSSAASTNEVAAGRVPAAGAGSAGSSAAASSAPAAGSADPAVGGSAAPAAGTPGAGTKLPDVGAGVVAADRQVIRTAAVTVDIAVPSTDSGAAADQQAQQDAVAKVATQVRTLATGAGYVSGADGQGATMSITLRVPADGYDNVMIALTRYGTIVSRQETTQDVTAQMIDIGSRMATMTASVNRVRALLSKADKIGDVISIESELTSREADLESLQRQQAGLAGQTALSTITVVLQATITGVKPVVPPPAVAARSGFVGGLINGWHGVRHAGHAVLTVVGTVIPFLPAVAVLVIGGLIWRRRVQRPIAPTLAAAAGDPHPGD